MVFTGGCNSVMPRFDGDNAYQYLIEQCSFGPRNPGSDGHSSCQDFIIERLKIFSDEVLLQEFSFQEKGKNKSYTGTNIIARFNRSSSFQSLIGAHWDTRPWADQDDNIANRSKPIIGANDGASGAAIMLELASIMAKTPPPIGVNLVFFDAEDSGDPGLNETYCQGSMYFAKHIPIPLPDEGIILDMVGDKQLSLPIERNSFKYHEDLVRRLWDQARELGLDTFKDYVAHAIYDDHVPLNEYAGISTIDIIDFEYPNSYTNFWHTLNDVPENCSAESLEQVGILITDYIYNHTHSEGKKD
tara:strand:+ start:2939 stop:3841 length:903 start_codon:yes stop_codon:yes gene_type:complete